MIAEKTSADAGICHRCEAHTESAYKEDEYGKRRADLSNRLRMRFIDSSGSSEMRS
jgi:hypothetical protein